MNILNFYHLGKKIPDGAVYIGRSMPHMGLQGSLFANPFKLTKGLKGEAAEKEREEILEKYRQYLFNKIKKNEITLEDLVALKDSDLVCFCAPQRCHGHVLRSAVAWACKQYGIEMIESSDNEKGLSQ